jgi:endoglucanase
MIKLRIYLYRSICFILIFSIAELFADVFINQEGYRPDSPKYVFVSGAADSFFVKDASGSGVVFQNALTLFKSNDPASGLTMYRGDFGSFQAPGRYYIEVNGLGTSQPFSIQDSVYDNVYRKSLKGFYFQRCGVSLPGPYAIPYFRNAGHVADGFYHSSSGLSGFRLATKGWHDAGDYGKYAVNAGITVGTMLMAYEEFPDRFAKDDLNIPESGNGIPDILDEARFELEWLLKMQDSTGGVYHKVTRENFSSYVMPVNDTGLRYIYEISSTATGDFAAMMARAYRVYFPIDTAFAVACLDAAELAWNFLETHPNMVPPGGFHNPSGTNTGQYGDSDDRDERLWAAAELFLSTGNPQYNNYYISNYNQLGLITGQPAWQNVKEIAHLSYLRGSRAGINSTVQGIVRTSLINRCESLLAQRNNTGFQVTMSPNDYYWGSNAVVLNRAVLLIFGYEETQDAQYLEAAADQLHYILGVNAHKLSFVTATGSNATMNPHHRPSIADGIADPIPGLLAGGPNRNLDDPILQANFNSSTPAALCYIDHQDSYGSNEIAINWNAALVFVCGYFSAANASMGINAPGLNLPDKIILFQNQPNPFNGGTVIRFQLKEPENVTLKIYDLLGKKIFEKSLGRMPAGEHRFRWNGAPASGGQLSSGIYYYSVELKERSAAKKMVYLK